MAMVLLTGGTGVLGNELRPRLVRAGYTVRTMSRHAATDTPAGGEWAQADLLTGDGLAQAVAGAEAVVHAASSPRSKTWQTDVDGTERLLRAAEQAGVGHFHYISIVGVDRVPLGYYRAKLAAEQLIGASAVPWTIFRATQFHPLIDMFLHIFTRLPIAFLPTSFKFQPVDAGEVAERMVQQLQAGPSGRVPDMGGPQVRTAGDLARAWIRACGRREPIVKLPLRGKIAGGFRNGYNCTLEHADGKITWEEWLAKRYRMPL